MEEHLQVAVQIASVALVHQTWVVQTQLFLCSEGEHHEEIRVRWASEFETNGLFPALLLEGFTD